MTQTIHRLIAPWLARLPDPTGVPPRRQVTGALVASALLHLLGFLLLVLLARFLPEPTAFAKTQPLVQEIEVQMLPAPEPPSTTLMARQTTPLFDARGLEESAMAPERAIFQSSQDMVAGSERAGKGSEPLPTQDGPDLPFVDFKNQEAITGKPNETLTPPPSEAAAPALSRSVPRLFNPRPLSKQYLEALAKLEAEKKPTASQQPATPVPEAAPEKPVEKRTDEIAITVPAPIPPVETSPSPAKAKSEPEPNPAAASREQLAMLTKPTKPQPVPNPSYQPELRKTRIEGSISNRGRPGVDAVKTPLGVYQKAVSAEIGARWKRYTDMKKDLLALGTVRVQFSITQEGRVEDVRVLSNEGSNSTFAGICEQSVRDAEIAPPPSSLEAMRDGRLELVFSFTLY